ncbi:8-amino-7-oxononanoate synthase [Acidihalobacter aeolianus]|uniref:8-amino-7-oxononanoate synthase n=1 Tax=Acidihalobacter aeolianus TaxID=2792603 RepID=A0A1D8KB67_9GAMM|nr:8-amino-7-oxononanoate synthase [Acidihalobacter aeolianus]AOV18209.1 8-amino-7-oxononanoate synthase [Acidihalobacter aeolianus]
MFDLHQRLEARRAAGLQRFRRQVEGPAGPLQRIDGREILSFCSNDYLGLAGHPAIAEALRRGSLAYGTGSGSAHLINGHSRAHHALEEALAEFVGRPRALLFSTGYMANLGTVAALVGRGDSVVEDRLNHASLIDAGTLSGAKRLRYAHADVDSARRQLSRAEGDTLLLTDGVFSMDGDVAPLPALVEAARECGAWLMVDDAHGIGVHGSGGRGTLARYGLGQQDAPVLMGTLGKALGTAGAFVAGDEDLIEYLIGAARTYLFTTAMPAALAEATLQALTLAREEEWRRERLSELIVRLRGGAAALGLTLMPSDTPIQPILIGDSAQALAVADALWAQGILVPAIRPPTVAEGQARLRITLSAAHEPEQVDRLLETLAAVLASPVGSVAADAT